ncbi:MAG: hypothetical protein N3F67_05800 [Acidilobaceae archaeon]|nr:hypothetical protein [Acidilobaceae archaeon]
MLNNFLFHTQGTELSLSKRVCRERECEEELEELLKAFDEIDAIASSLQALVKVEPSSYPLISNVNMEELISAAKQELERRGIDVGGVSKEAIVRGEAEGAGGLLSLVIRRALYKRVKGSLPPDAPAFPCPVCGLYPIAGVMKRVKGAIFSMDVVELHCLCGYSTTVEQFHCPVCGNKDKQAFDLYVAGDITYRACIKCGHVIGIAKEEVEGEKLPIAIAYSISRHGWISRSA